MPRHYVSIEAQCPFYRMEDAGMIWCEGPSDEWTLCQEIKDRLQADLYIENYCHGDWAQCQIARMLWSRHDSTGNLRYMRRAKPYRVRGEKI